MKILFSIFCLLFVAGGAFAQAPDVLAAMGTQNFTVADLPAEVAANYTNQPQIIQQARGEMLTEQIADMLLAAEARARKTTVENLLATEVKAKISPPTDAQIQAIYDGNRDKIGDKTLAEVRPEIVAFLTQDTEQKLSGDYLKQLAATYKLETQKDVNAPLLMPTDVLAAITGDQLTVKKFEDVAAPKLYAIREQIYLQVRGTLEDKIISQALDAEAKQLGITPNEVVDREVTAKVKTDSAYEKDKAVGDLINRLYQKYSVKILLKEPVPIRQNIAILPFNPSRGLAAAPVTVVMFSDFQCPACSRSHPVLDGVLAEYPGKIRFIVRDYPLTNLHPDSYNAALAAAAAKAQGKFFEYTDILYKNQDKLDNASLKKYASDLGLNRQKFDADLDGKKFEAEVKKDIADGTAYGITGTPTIYVNGVQVYDLSGNGFRRAIDAALKKPLP